MNTGVDPSLDAIFETTGLLMSVGGPDNTKSAYARTMWF